MTVNPKKLRPYDQPPKRRRKLIPDGPDSAATGFFIAAALWLAVATALGALAIGLRLVTFEISFPLLFGYSFELDQRRVEYAFVNATVYGWLTNAGFAAIAFMTPRLLGRRMAMEAGLVGAFAIWNMSLAGGITALYVFDLGPNAPLSALLWLFDGGLAFGALLVTIAFLVTAAASLRTSYVGLWFAAVALLSIAGLTGLNALIGLVELFVDLPELLVALTSVFVERAISVMWLLGIAYATLHYVVPRAAGQPLASAGLGWLSFLAWLMLAPLAGLATLVDVSIPFAITSLGHVAGMLLLVPAALTVVNLVQTLSGRWTLLFGPGSIAFATVALAFLLAVSLLDAIASLRIVQDFVGRTDWERGAWLWATYGTFTFAAFAMADHAAAAHPATSVGWRLPARRAAVARVRRRDPRRAGAHGRRHGRGFLTGAGHRSRRGGGGAARLPRRCVRRDRDGGPGRPGIGDEPVPHVRQRRAGRVQRAGRFNRRGSWALSRR